MARFERLAEEYGHVATFAFVYIREAHPSDEWQKPENVEEGIVHEQPRTLAARLELAGTLVDRFGIRTPTLVDDLGDTASACYAAWPARVYVIETDGEISFKSGVGPRGFQPKQLRAFLVERFDRAG